MKTAKQWAHEKLTSNPGLSLESFIEQVMQAQHEATWAMAMEAAAKANKEQMSGHPDDHEGDTSLAIASVIIKAIPCPPLPTNHETVIGE